MIHWIWLIPTLLVGGLLGIFITANIMGEDDHEDDHDREIY